MESSVYIELKTNSAIDFLRLVLVVAVQPVSLFMIRRGSFFENWERRRMKCTSFIGCLTVQIGCIEDLFDWKSKILIGAYKNIRANEKRIMTAVLNLVVCPWSRRLPPWRPSACFSVPE